MPPRRRSGRPEGRVVSVRAALLLVAALVGSAALQRPSRSDGACSLSAQKALELRVAVVRSSVRALARAPAQPGNGGTHPLAAHASGPTSGAPRVPTAAIGARSGTRAPRRVVLPSPRAPPLG